MDAMRSTGAKATAQDRDGARPSRGHRCPDGPNAGFLVFAASVPLGIYAATIYARLLRLGGVGFVGGMGLLIAGIAISALILHLTPRWIAWGGLVLATLAEISFLTLVVPELAIPLPIGRFLGLVWLLVIGFLLPRTRHNTGHPSTVDGSQV